MNLASALTILFLPSCLATMQTDDIYFSRVRTGDEVKEYFRVPNVWSSVEDLGYYGVRMTSIQADHLGRCKVLVAIGSHLRCGYDGNSTIETGSNIVSGNQNGNSLEARYKEITGFVQLPNGEVFISDQGNQCIRKLNRYTHSVSTFRCHNKKLTGYVPWETFSQTSTMQYDDVTNTVYLLDVKYGRSVIVGLQLDTNSTFIAPPQPTKTKIINDFLYDSTKQIFTILEDSVFVRFANNSYSNRTWYYGSGTAIASYDDVFVVTTTNGHVFFYDTKARFDGKEKLKVDLENPTAVAIIDGYLYVGNIPTRKVAGKLPATVYRTSFKLVLPATSSNDPQPISSGAVVAICLGVFSIVVIIPGIVIFVVWKRTRKTKNQDTFAEAPLQPASSPGKSELPSYEQAMQQWELQRYKKGHNSY